MGEIIGILSHSNRNIFPVITENGQLKGIVVLDDIKEIMFKTELYKVVTATQVMKSPPASIDLHEDMTSVMRKIDKTGAWNLPVVQQGRYIGFISKSSIFMAYRHFSYSFRNVEYPVICKELKSANGFNSRHNST